MNVHRPTPGSVGVFQALSHTDGVARRDYKLYVPSSYTGMAAPLFVMLHGCNQDADDFASGTRMNELAELHGFLVAFPEKDSRANCAHCWNWFDVSEQSRGGEEPSLIAGIACSVGDSHCVDTERVFVAGLSAGAAMAVIVASAYPDVFKGVAAHSGLPVGAAHNAASAFAAMQGWRRPKDDESVADGSPNVARTIVFHGDRDTTVALSNGREVIGQVTRAFESHGEGTLVETVTQENEGGRLCAVVRLHDPKGLAVVENWTVRGGSHSWFGGSPNGSYTDARGPNASAHIVRFFLSEGVSP